MVDALHAAHRRVRRGGLVIDARLDASRRPRVIARGRVRLHLRRVRDADLDRRADAAIDRVISRGLFRRHRRGVLWYGARFTGLAELEKHLDETGHYFDYERGTRRRVLPFRREPLTMRRAVKYEVLTRL